MTEKDEEFKLFGQEEREMLKYTIGIRKKMVDDKIEEGIFGNGDMRVVNETLNGLDSSLLALAKLEQDENKNKDDGVIKSELIAIMRDRRINRTPEPNRITELPDDAYDGVILDTELSEPGEQLEPNDFLEEIK